MVMVLMDQSIHFATSAQDVTDTTTSALDVTDTTTSVLYIIDTATSAQDVIDSATSAMDVIFKACYINPNTDCYMILHQPWMS